MNFPSKLKILILISILLLSLNALPVFAANGVNGDAVFSTAVPVYHHVGILKYGSDGSNKVIEENGSGPITYDDWTTFLDGGSYLGAFYHPNNQPASSILNTATTLMYYPAIQYSPMGQMTIDSTADYLVMPEHITALRCDGFVEYCYEFNNSRIWGQGSNRDTNWDISLKPNVSAHYCIGIDPSITVSPYVQHTGYPYYSTLISR